MVGGAEVEVACICPAAWVVSSGGGNVGVLDTAVWEGEVAGRWVGAISCGALQAARKVKLVKMQIVNVNFLSIIISACQSGFFISKLYQAISYCL